jgi:hypothetical protein
MEYFESPSCAGTSDMTLKLLPKKLKDKICPRKTGWGLHAYEELSLFRIFVTMVVVMVLSVIFFAVWLRIRPGDVQTALSLPSWLIALYTVVLFIPQLLSPGYL